MLTRGGVGASGRHWLKWLCTSMSEVGVTGNSCSGVSGHSEISELTLSTSSNRWLRLPSCCCCGHAQDTLRRRKGKRYHNVWLQLYPPRQTLEWKLVHAVKKEAEAAQLALPL